MKSLSVRFSRRSATSSLETGIQHSPHFQDPLSHLTSTTSSRLLEHQRCHQLSALKVALPAALSPALAMALWLVAFNVSSCHAQVINASQGLFLSDVKTGWGIGWKVGDKCSTVASIRCDASGMITSM
ncbi:unnamed protein product [Closterium sp. NIES-65]|nr:unnamed protein product [Closterium sp. NIES-65]